MHFLRRYSKWILGLLGGLLALALAALGWFGWIMQGSLAALDGTLPLAGLTQPVRIERDAQGIPTLQGISRADIARATGFVHAQDRFFQMDLLRRRAAGELAELFGAAALEVDKAARLHGFRRTAREALALISPEDRALLDAYTAGVNAGLAALPRQPWEYYVLRTGPVAWRPEDSFLCVYSMWFDLQDSTGRYERNLQALRSALGPEALAFFAPLGDSHDAALDGSTYPAPALPPLKLKRTDTALVIDPAAELRPGSNNFAVAGAHTATGAAMVANDMHLGLSVPHVWYRATFAWSDAAGAHRVTGVTLPGAPLVIAGSNGRIAWGFTNSYIDTVDVVLAETDAIGQSQYRTPQGYRDFEERTEQIAVKGGTPVALTTKWSEWGPVISGPSKGRYLVHNWTAHRPDATNLSIRELETARTAAEAVAVAHRAGMPNQNLLVADADGHIAWTPTGRIVQRQGFDGRLPVSWAYGDRAWTGWLPGDQTPVVADPGDGFLWTANNRVIGGEAFARLGDGGYDDGLRAGAIRDDLRTLVASGKKVAPTDLLAVQLDDRGRYLERWQKLLLDTLTDDVVAKKSSRGQMRELVRAWGGHASVDSVGYRLIRTFRAHVLERTLAPFAEAAQDYEEKFNFNQLHTEDAVWRLVHEQPVKLLNPAQVSWDSLLLAAADDVLADADKAGLPLPRFTWGERNTLRMQHPFSRFLPGFLAELLDMPAVQLPGDSKMPRVQGVRFGASERMVVSPGREAEGILEVPGGQSGHPLSPYYRTGQQDWVAGRPAPFLPGPTQHTLTLTP